MLLLSGVICTPRVHLASDGSSHGMVTAATVLSLTVNTAGGLLGGSVVPTIFPLELYRVPKAFLRD